MLCLLLLVACWLLTGLLLRSRFRSNWLCSAHAQLRPTFLERLGRRPCAGWSELAPPSLPFTFITGVGAGVPDSWSGPTDIQLPDTQLSDTQLPDIQLPGHSGPRTFSSPDTQVFWTSRSFGHSGPRTFSSPDTQVFWTSSSFGHPGLLDIQLFWTYVGIGYIMPTLGG